MLTYSRKDAFDRAVGNNSVCKSCAQMDRKISKSMRVHWQSRREELWLYKKVNN